ARRRHARAGARPLARRLAPPHALPAGTLPGVLLPRVGGGPALRRDRDASRKADGPFVSLDVLVIGGGPAGLEAARALASGQRKVLVIDREAELGGIPRHCHHSGFGW